MINHDVLIQRSYELTPLSPTIVRLAELVSNPGADMGAIVRTLSWDPALAGAVLRQANSAKFGGRTEIVSVQDAVVRLGPGAILSLATQAGLRKTADRSLPQYGFSEGAFWRQCRAAALAVDVLRKLSSIVIPAAAGTAALLRDIGKLAMAEFLSSDCLDAMWRACRDAGCSSDEAEREILGVDHAEVGGLIAQHWRLPESIRHGITYHHDPVRGEHVISDVVHVASWVADRACLGAEVPPGLPHRDAVMRLGLQARHLEESVDIVVARLLEDLDSKGQ